MPAKSPRTYPLLDENGDGIWELGAMNYSYYKMGRLISSGNAVSGYATRAYDAAGRLSKLTDRGVATLYEYDSRGRRSKVAIDMNANNQIDLAGTDRITSYTYEFGQGNINPLQPTVSYNYARTTVKTWAQSGADSPAVVSISDASTDGLFSSTRRDSTGPATTIERSTGPAAITARYHPSGKVDVTETSYGRTTAVKEIDSASNQLTKTTYAYDTHGRLASSTDARKGATTYTYHNDDSVNTVTEPDPDGAGALGARTTTYAYDDLGRVTGVTHPDGTTTLRDYDLAGRVTSVSGTREYPVDYTYDASTRPP
ncbi:MAG: RHS repeat domain-containing protein [Verrucomicrobiales bacterium]